jgi:hypothetical protein
MSFYQTPRRTTNPSAPAAPRPTLEVLADAAP